MKQDEMEFRKCAWKDLMNKYLNLLGRDGEEWNERWHES